MNNEDKELSAAVQNGLSAVICQMTRDKIKIPKHEQCEAVESLFNGVDTVGILCTGFGKSMIFFSLAPLHGLLTGNILFFLCKRVAYLHPVNQ